MKIDGAIDHANGRYEKGGYGDTIFRLWINAPQITHPSKNVQVAKRIGGGRQ